jgi:GTPase involved in cell partitioning and DNA repair
MFIDKLDIDIRSGKGGDGAATFRRENSSPKVVRMEVMAVGVGM